MDVGFRLGSWLVQPSLNIVSRNGTTVRLEPKVMSVLVCLAEHPGEPVSKENLLQTVWPDTFVSEAVLHRSISELRRAFENGAKEPQVIQTIAKRGYRLVSPVVRLNGVSVKTSPAVPATEAGMTRPDGQKRWFFWLALGGAVLLVGLAAPLKVNHLPAWLFGDTGPRIHSLAVLPLQNLSGDPSQEYFSDGMTEELITELSRINGMKVISRMSVMRYKNTNKSLPEIASQLGVDGIVVGSVLRSGDRVRITAQLIYARTDANVWAETYDRNSQDIFALQEAVARAIAAKVKATMIPSAAAQERTARRVNLKAHEAYLRGFHEDDIVGTLANHEGMQQATTEHNNRAVAYYKQAIQEDPGYARAYLALAFEDWTPEQVKEEETYARKALALDDNLSDAHLLIGAIKLVQNRNWADAEREILRAIELNPSSPTAHHAYAYLLDAEGRLDEGMKEWERSQELDPGNDHLAAALYSRREFDRLIELERNELARNTGGSAYISAVAHKTMMVCYARQGRHKESVEEFRLGLMAYGYDALAEDLRRGYARGGYEAALREWLKGVQREKTEFPFPFLVTYAYAELGERDAALAWLPKLEFEGGWESVAWQKANIIPTLVTLRIEPMWDPLRSDPRFEDLARRVGLPQ